MIKVLHVMVCRHSNFGTAKKASRDIAMQMIYIRSGLITHNRKLLKWIAGTF